MAGSIKGLGSGSIGASSSGSPVEQVRPSATVGTPTSAPRSNSDNVQITESARSLAALSQAVQDTPEIDTQRVQALQQAIDGGQYTVNPERIADGLLQFERLFSTAK